MFLSDPSLADLETTHLGPVKVVTAAGTLTVNDGDGDATGVWADQAGNVLLEAQASDGDVVLNADVESVFGHVSIVAGDDVEQNADVSTTGGTIRAPHRCQLIALEYTRQLVLVLGYDTTERNGQIVPQAHIGEGRGLDGRVLESPCELLCSLQDLEHELIALVPVLAS